MAPKYWEALEWSEALDFQIGYAILKTPLLALENDFWYVLVSLPQEIQDLSCNFSLVLI